jgi:DNA-binding transcriptional ArsR family regulator
MAPVGTSDELSVTFGALADPTRRGILSRLTEGDAAVNELAALFPAISLQAVSKHLQVLERAGLVTRGRFARQRPAHLRTEPIAEATAWLAHYHRFYEESLDRLGEHLARLQQGPPDDHAPDPEGSRR